MCDTTRKCTKCGQEIPIIRDDIHGVALLKGKFYHTECLTGWAQDRVQRPRHAEYWEFALEHMDVCEEDARKAINKRFCKDDFNEYLLNTYDVIDIPSRFWSIVGDLENGKYRKRKCKPVTLETLYGAWKWGQKNLDKIDRGNRMNNKGPKDGEQRLNYDLAILVQKVPLYLKHQAKQQAEEAERLERQKSAVKINYNNIANNSVASNNGLDDISSLIDDIFD